MATRRTLLGALVAGLVAPRLAFAQPARMVSVVFTSAADPVAAGLVAALVRPGGNATGAFQSLPDAEQVRFELIREVYPGLKRVGVLLDRRSPDSSQQETAHQVAARRVGLELVTAKFTNFEAVAKILANLRRAGIVAVGLTSSYTLIARRREIVETALRNKLALIGHRSEWAEVGALMTYGAEVADAQRRSARIAHRILNGVKPAGIPVERSTKTELVVNQRTARTLGITIPGSVLRRADRVIE